jgi:hypothetical protein
VETLEKLSGQDRGRSGGVQPPRRRTPEGGGVVGFLFGALVGAAIGGYTGLDFSSLYWIVACGMVCGVLGYFFGDRFFFWLAHWPPWV